MVSPLCVWAVSFAKWEAGRAYFSEVLHLQTGSSIHWQLKTQRYSVQHHLLVIGEITWWFLLNNKKNQLKETQKKTTICKTDKQDPMYCPGNYIKYPVIKYNVKQKKTHQYTQVIIYTIYPKSIPVWIPLLHCIMFVMLALKYQEHHANRMVVQSCTQG